MDGILTIQSWVSYGHVGNAAAVFPLQRLGFETWAVNTVQFSNHTGYESWRGRVGTAEEVRAVIEGIGERGLFPRCPAVLTGYLGSEDMGEVVLDAVAAVKAANPQALWCCDPVMGDIGDGFYVRPGLPEFFRDRAIPAADIATPNRFELEFLTGRPAASLEAALEACAALRAMGPKIVLLTSFQRRADRMGLLASTGDGAWLVETPLLPLSVSGAGDALAALFLGHLLRSGAVDRALSEASSALFGVLDATARSGEREIQLVAAQAELVRPSQVFAAERVA
ncbi:MAG TPA: pyridoxal kinase PdxY [Aliidongia sp.]|nr:pyridoxal kinase PdxY [Aliidongia sp.]